MRARDHERFVKAIRHEHAEEMRDARYSTQKLSDAVEYRHALVDMYERAFDSALGSEDLPADVKAMFLRVFEVREAARRLYGEGAGIAEVLAVME
jgi:hypothetical protein